MSWNRDATVEVCADHAHLGARMVGEFCTVYGTPVVFNHCRFKESCWGYGATGSGEWCEKKRQGMVSGWVWWNSSDLVLTRATTHFWGASRDFFDTTYGFFFRNLDLIIRYRSLQMYMQALMWLKSSFLAKVSLSGERWCEMSNRCILVAK